MKSFARALTVVAIFGGAMALTLGGAVTAYAATPPTSAPPNLSVKFAPKDAEIRWDAATGATKYEIMVAPWA